MREPDLLRFLRCLQEECGGIIPFERYMREALYHPVFGYYSARIRNIGAEGDFSTSATLGKNLGRAIAAWIRRRGSDEGWRRIPVIEVGGGNGMMARTILSHLGWKFRLRVDYMIHETSRPLRNLQKGRLRWRGVRWIDSLKGALQRLEGRALIFSNELVDAFPCRLFEKGGEGWSELGVQIQTDGSLCETRLATEIQDPWFGQFQHLPNGQRVERHQSYGSWLREWAPAWREGSILTIDYGKRGENLHERRPGGSLRAYYRQERLTGTQVYARFGMQDLTADVNFSDLIAWGNESGWKTVFLGTQREFQEFWLGRPATDRASLELGPAEEEFFALEQSAPGGH